jgi:hypothetical protein
VTTPLLLLILVSAATAQYSGGTGEPCDPYQIATAADLIALGETPADYDKHFILTSDIDLDPNLSGGKVFDNAVISPIRGFARPIGPVRPIFTGVFDGNGRTIRNLTIRGKDYLGLFGALGPSSAVSNLGLEAVDVNGTGTGIASLASYNYYGCVVGCYSVGAVRGLSLVGGFVSCNYGNIINCYDAGAVSGYDTVGGFVGNNIGNISNSHSISRVSGNQDTGGLAGRGFGSVLSCFWDIQTSGQISSAGGTGLTSTGMRDIRTYLDAGWDFVDESLCGTCDLWQMMPGECPTLRCFSGCGPMMPEGLGTPEHPYLIRSTQDLGAIWFKPGAYYRLEASIDLSGITWSTAVIPWFGGYFEGNGCVLSNLRIEGGGYLGLIGQVQSRTTISNLGMDAASINGTGRYVGSLVGDHGGVISSCRSAGEVGGSIYVGGLVGSSSTGVIANSYSTAVVRGYRSYAGGLVGCNDGGVCTNTYSIGSVDGSVYVGGPVGCNHGSVNSSFWDVQTSNQASSAGGTGKTTAEMQMAKTFLDAGWDFVDETAKDTQDTWWIDEGVDYPRLWWEPRESVWLPVVEAGVGACRFAD